MKLIVGLGNPGKKYEKTRHNFGFMVIDRLANKYGEKFLIDKRFETEICEIFVDGEKVYLAKPQTFMNKSGESVKEIISYFDISTDRVWAVHDDVDLPLGTVRVRADGGSAGHKGVQSIIDQVGTNNFVRFRMGIASKHCDELTAEEVVLRNFEDDEWPLVDEATNKAVEEIEKGLKDGIEHLTT